MRTWGRVQQGYNGDGTPNMVWVKVETDPNGQNDHVYLTTLAQVLKLNLNESYFYANYGIPARESVISQLFPDLYVSITQQQFAVHFASLLVSRQPLPTPTYIINALTHYGVVLNASVPIPT